MYIDPMNVLQPFNDYQAISSRFNDTKLRWAKLGGASYLPFDIFVTSYDILETNHGKLR